MKLQFFDLLTESVREVFETMSFLAVGPAKPLAGNADLEGQEITALVCLAGEISGLLALHCKRSFARECSNLIVGGEEGIPAPDAVLMDTVGELANMIAGTLKRRMSAHVDLFDISLPTVLLSAGHSLACRGAKDDFPRLLIPFALSEEQSFFVELLYHKR